MTGQPTPAQRPLQWIWGLYALSVLLVTLQKGLTHPGNFLLFRCTFERLIHDQDLYVNTPGCGGFLYSPAFAFLFAPFALLPPLLGLFCWNAINAAAPAIAISRLLGAHRARIVLVFIYLDVVRSLQNSQSNALVAGLLILTFLACERGRIAGAALATGAGALIKIFPAAGGLFALVAPQPARTILNRVLVFAAVGVGLALTPLLVSPPAVVGAQYHAWLTTTTSAGVLRGESLLGILATWFGYAGPNWPVQLAGALTLVAPLVVLRHAAA
ncbi:MAG TPA: glycosyltransferase family 87 protein, partial [Gemmatimonadales bacterium]|nr:glycosyltransferase family 87 protein [Gemmatimonadales bacterium]